MRILNNAQDMTKAQILHRVGRLLNEAKQLIGHSNFLGEEVEDLEILLTKIENQYASLVDDHMSAKYKRHNRETAHIRQEVKNGKK